jgi:hypothetical protein
MLSNVSSTRRSTVWRCTPLTYLIAWSACLAGCAPTEPAFDRWTHLGLDQKTITALAGTDWGLFAATTWGDVYHYDEATGDWDVLGLHDAINSGGVTTLLFVTEPTPRLLVGVNAGGLPLGFPEAGIFAVEDRGATWKPWNGGLVVDDGFAAYSLARDPGRSERLYIGTWSAILRSEDGGLSWERVYGEFIGAGPGIRHMLVSPHRDGGVWATIREDNPLATEGEPTKHTVLLRSDDWGDTWERVVPQGLDGSSIQTLAVDPFVADRMWLAGRSLFRSDDRGTTWIVALDSMTVAPRTVLIPNSDHFTGLAFLDNSLYTIGWSYGSGYHLAAPVLTSPASTLAIYRLNPWNGRWEVLMVPPTLGGESFILSNDTDEDALLMTGGRSGVWRFVPN